MTALYQIFSRQAQSLPFFASRVRGVVDFFQLADGQASGNPFPGHGRPSWFWIVRIVRPMRSDWVSVMTPLRVRRLFHIENHLDRLRLANTSDVNSNRLRRPGT